MARERCASDVDRRAFIGMVGSCALLTGCGEGDGTGAATTSLRSAEAPSSTTSVAAAGAYTWPAYTSVPTYRYGFATTSSPALTVRADRGGVAKRTLRGYVAFSEGASRNPALTDAMVALELDRLNADLKIAWETIGFAPDKGFARGNYLNYYLLGSGLADDDFTATTEGGYQGSQWFDGQWWPCTCTSYHAISKAFEGDALQRSNITHETIHVLQSGTGSFVNAGWFHEAHNDYFGSRLIFLRDGTRTLGFLDAISALGPHIPIEAFAGWMKDGSFGPSSPEANMNPRDFFGGAQYCCTFPLFLHLHVGTDINNWLWKNNRPDSETVLQTLARGLGTAQAQRAVAEYRARLALVDFGDWRTPLRSQIDGAFAAQPYMYAATTLSGSTLTPATETLPGTTGANYIPLTVSGSRAQVTFAPASADMRCQLAYRATDGSAVYGTPVASGVCALDLTKPPADGVVIAVVTSVELTHSRTSKFGYALTPGSGMAQADRTARYF